MWLSKSSTFSLQKLNFQEVKVELLERKSSTFGKRKFNRIFIRPFPYVYTGVFWWSVSPNSRFPLPEFFRENSADCFVFPQIFLKFAEIKNIRYADNMSSFRSCS